ncbi:putative cytochrome P450 [Triangularia setosa]|uniref:Cytochrome P450 n=1 Tax=Triangularia setosa TaxID=2587417 RepID=A0AAN7A809_9PEZI|nr:putative cytochrome P450 [Podospora setosa]
MFFSSEAASASFLLPLTARDFLSYACVVAALFFIYINTSFGIIGSACEDIEGWLSEQKSVINFSFAGVSKSSDTLPLRAAANENLAIAFNITNSLTTISPSTHKFFLKTASSIINRSDRDWTVLFETARSTLIAELIRDTSQPLHLAEVTRITCLIVVLVDNFHVPSPASLPRESLVIITDQINDQWLKAKLSTKPVPSPLLSHHLSILQLALRSSDRVLKPEEILGTIMPQYETLWRVVLVTYLLAFHLYSSPTLQDRISSVPECLGTNFDEEKEALKLAKEGLRLTPSNKRIYRHTPAPNSQKVKADLELMHRHPSIWGWSALKFNPSRFDNLTKLQTEAYLPYSIRPHRCPASGGFGDRMVTCLVVAMGRVLDTATGKVDNVGYPCNAERKGVIGTARDELEGWRYTPTVYK